MKTLLTSFFTLCVFAASAQTSLKFEKVASMASPAYNFGYTNSDQDIFTLGGTQGFMKFTSVLQIYGSKTEKWILVDLKDVPLSLNTSLLYLPEYNGLLVMGGSQQAGNSETIIKEARVINLEKYSASSLGELPLSAKKMGIAEHGGKVYFFGGFSNKSRFEPPVYSFNDKLYSYNFETGAIEELPKMPKAMETNGGIVDGNLYVFGGYDGRSLDNIWKYNLEGKEWSELSGFSKPISSYAMAQYKHYFILVGDYDNGDRLIVYNTKNQKSTEFQTNFRGRNMGASILNDYLYVYGGQQPYPNKEQLQETYRISIKELIPGIDQ